MTGSSVGRGNQYIQLVKVLYCKGPTNHKLLPAFPLEVGRDTNSNVRGGRQECSQSATVAHMDNYVHLLCHVCTPQSTTVYVQQCSVL